MKEKLGYELYHSAKLATRGCRLDQRHSDNRGREKQGNFGIYVVVEQIDNRYLESKLGKASRGSLLMKLDSINDWEMIHRLTHFTIPRQEKPRQEKRT